MSHTTVVIMAWKHRYPLPEEYDTLEDYEEACKLYEWAESQYVDECVENYYEEKYGTDN